MHKRLFCIFLINIFIGNAVSVHAQNYVDLFSIGSAYSPDNSLKNSENKINVGESAVNLKFPVLLKNKDVLFFGFNASSLTFNNHYMTSDDEPFYSAALQIGYTKHWNDNWSTMLVVIPKISSDMKDVTSKDYQTGGLLIFTYTKKENLKYKFGLYYNQECFGPLFVPILGINWQPTYKISAFGNLPINFTLDYKIGKRFSTGIYFQSLIDSYRLSEKYNSVYLQKNSQDVSLFFNTYFAKNIVLTIKGGHSIGSSYLLYNEGDKLKAGILSFQIGNKRTPLNVNLDDGFIIEMKLSYRIFTK
ncbi:MAG: DUF6268 family outer membrane beta-barrel protein [Bacteroidales bacterium]|jgi:hypothetical protein